MLPLEFHLYFPQLQYKEDTLLSIDLFLQQNRNETNNINYSITSPLNINVSSQSNPQEIANIVNRSLSDHWDSQMRAAKQNIYRG
jgi:hypothetical protein